MKKNTLKLWFGFLSFLVFFEFATLINLDYLDKFGQDFQGRKAFSYLD